MPRLSFDCEELLHWWEPKTDISFIFNFNWRSLQQLREAITVFLSARLFSVAQRAAQSISETGCPHLKCLLASNPNTPADLLDYLLEVSNSQIHVRIAENPNTSKETLSKLAFSHDPDVRAAIVDNPGTPESCFKRLINDESVDVRYRIAENPHAPLTSLYSLLRDENPYVSQRARQTLARILSNTLALAGRKETAEFRPELTLAPEDPVSRLNLQLLEDMNEIDELITLDYSVPKPETKV